MWCTSKVAYCRSLGADVVIDKSVQPGDQHWWAEALRHAASYREFRGFHAVFDANGVSTLRQSYKNTLPGGKLVVYGFHSMLPKKGGILGALQWVRSRPGSALSCQPDGCNRPARNTHSLTLSPWPESFLPTRNTTPSACLECVHFFGSPRALRPRVGT